MNLNRLSRRSFLSRTAVGIGLMAQGNPARRVLGANQRVRIGMIGAGGRGSDLLRMVLRRSEEKNDVEVAALCDVYRKRLHTAAEHVPEAQTYLHHQELLERQDLEAVFIATPDHWHAPITLAAMQSGKDVYCEKPMTLHWEEAKEVARQARDLKRILQIGVQALSWSKWHKVKEIVDQGMLGKIVICQGTYSRNAPGGDWNYTIDPAAGPQGKGEDFIDWHQWLGPAPQRPYDADRFFRFRKYWDYSGGIATDLHYHTVAPFHLAVRNDHPIRVIGLGGIWLHKDGREVPDTFLTAADYPGEYSLHVPSSQANAHGIQTLIRGEKATLYCGADWEGETYGVLRVVPEDPFQEEFVKKWGVHEYIIPHIQDEGDQKHVNNFIECVQSRQTPHCHADLAYKVMTTIDLSVQSYRDGKMYHFDAEKEQVF